MKNEKKLQFRWAMYDWACSAYNLVITSTVFPIYFIGATQIEPDKPQKIKFLGIHLLNTTWYNYLYDFAFIIVALLLPIATSIADTLGNKRVFMRFFTILGSASCAALYFFDYSHIPVGFIAMVLACISAWLSLVFYNAYLVEICSVENRDKLSAYGYSLGYIGSVILQIISFVLIIFNTYWGITKNQACQISFILVGVWWVGWGEFSYRKLPIKPSKLRNKNWIKQSFKTLLTTFNEIKKQPKFFRYLISFFTFSCGIQTVMLAATIFGKSELQLEEGFLIATILLIQLIAIPGAYFVSYLAKTIGNIKGLIFCVFLWIFVIIYAIFIPAKSPILFLIAGVLVGFIMGGIQSLARSTYSKFIDPEKDTAVFFSFYDFTEKISIILGLFLFGFLNEIFGSQRYSLFLLLFVFLIALFLLYRTKKIVHL